MRIRQYLPDAKVLLVLRDPVERARSAWRQNWLVDGVEPRTFDEAVRDEISDLWLRCMPKGYASLSQARQQQLQWTELASRIDSRAWVAWDVPGGRVGQTWVGELMNWTDTDRGSLRPSRHRDACICHCCWLMQPAEPHGQRVGSCRQYLAKGLVSRKLQVFKARAPLPTRHTHAYATTKVPCHVQAWRASFGQRLLVLQFEALVADAIAAAKQIKSFVNSRAWAKLPVLHSTQVEQIRASSAQKVWHHSKDGKVFTVLHQAKGVPSADTKPTRRPSSSMHASMPNASDALTTETERSLVSFYASDMRRLRALEPTLRWDLWPRWGRL